MTKQNFHTEIDLIEIDDDFIIKCPFCDRTVKLITNLRFIPSNFYTHIRVDHKELCHNLSEGVDADANVSSLSSSSTVTHQVPSTIRSVTSTTLSASVSGASNSNSLPSSSNASTTAKRTGLRKNVRVNK